ncbi:uncharacterized protein LOC134771355 [Penaeus indicus]|uniref:uncharacterized protein LOC134771355 n=1 Tax=Penaeus indicus TaxID=29960 RepID=UPI00300C5DAB
MHRILDGVEFDEGYLDQYQQVTEQMRRVGEERCDFSLEGQKDAAGRDKKTKVIGQVVTVKSKDERILKDEENIKNRWKSYFEELYNEENERVQNTAPVQGPFREITSQEVKGALKRMKKNKACGPDGFPVEVWKVLGDVLWERKIDSRLRDLITPRESHLGFLPGKGTTDAIFMLKKYREGRENFHLVFIDLGKAYNRVPRDEIWRSLRLKGVPEYNVKSIKDMYQNSTTTVRSAAGETDPFEV